MGMPLSPGRFNGLLRQMGQQVLWRRAALCPCRSIDSGTGAARLGCRQCRGKGTLWAAAAPAWTGFQAMKPSREAADFGRWESGDVILTVPGASPLHAAGEHDQVVMTQGSEPFQLVLERDGDERLTFPVVQVDRCLWLRPDEELVESTPPAVAEDGTLSWPDPATAPEPGVQFTITGRRRPVYFVWKELPQDRGHFGGLALPRRIHARRFDLFGR